MRLREPPVWPTTVAVVGGGRMGSGIAEAFAAGGLSVRVADATPELARAARERVIAMPGCGDQRPAVSRASSQAAG